MLAEVGDLPIRDPFTSQSEGMFIESMIAPINAHSAKDHLQNMTSDTLR